MSRSRIISIFNSAEKQKYNTFTESVKMLYTTRRNDVLSSTRMKYNSNNNNNRGFQCIINPPSVPSGK